MRGRARSYKRVRLFFVLAAFPFFALFPYLRAVNNPNELVRVFTTMALVDDATLAIDEQVATYGWVNDMAHVPSKFDGGKLHDFIVKTPLSTCLGVPVYFAYAKVQALLGASPPRRRLHASFAAAHQEWLFGVQLPDPVALKRSPRTSASASSR